MRHLRLKAAFACSIGLAVMMNACGGDTPVAPNNPSDNSTSSGASSGGSSATNPNPNATPAPVTGIGVTLVSTNFEDDRCTQLSKPQYEGVTELVEVATVTNGTAREVYAFPAIYHSDQKGCGATDEHPGGTVGLMQAPNIPAGQSANWTHTFKIPERRCGRWQFDNDAKNGEISKSTLRGGIGGRVIDSGVDCPDCGTTDVTVIITGEGLTRTVKVTFRGQKPNKKATVDFGDGSATVQLGNGGSVQHTWPYGSYTVTASLNVEGLDLPCVGTAPVNNNPPTCDDYTPPTFGGALALTNQTDTQVTVTAGTVTPTGGTWSPTALPSVEDRPKAGEGDDNFCDTYTKGYGPENLRCTAQHEYCIPIPQQEDQCKDHFLRVKVKIDDQGNLGYKIESSNAGTLHILGQNIPFPAGTTGPTILTSDLECGQTIEWSVETPCDEASGSVETDACERSCEDVSADVNCSATGDDAACVVSWVNPGTGSIKLNSGSWASIANGATKNYNDLDNGSYEVTLKVVDGRLECPATDEFTIDVEETCELPSPQALICHEPFGSTSSECGFFGLVALGKDDELEGSSHVASRDADLVIVKDGRGTCEQGQSAYRTYTNVQAGDVLLKPEGAGAISHVTYCGCPVED